MNLSAPLTDVSPSLHGAVLTVLADAHRNGQVLSGRSVAARINSRGSQEGVRRVLVALVEAGVVNRVEAPPAALYALNQDHLAVPHLLALHGVREELFVRMQELIATWRVEPVSAVLFGSVARGDSAGASDIDVMLVRPTTVGRFDDAWLDQWSGLFENVHGWTGSWLNVIDYSVDDWRRGVQVGDPFLGEVTRDGRTLFGLRPSVLTRRIRRHGTAAA